MREVGPRRFSFLRPATLPYQITVNAVDIEDYLSVRDQTATILDRMQIKLDLSTNEFNEDSKVDPLQVLELLLTERILGEVAEICNRFLSKKDLRKTSTKELRCLLRVVFTACAYGISIKRLFENSGELFRLDGLMEESRARSLLGAMQGAPSVSINGTYTRGRESR